MAELSNEATSVAGQNNDEELNKIQAEENSPEVQSAEIETHTKTIEVDRWHASVLGGKATKVWPQRRKFVPATAREHSTKAPTVSRYWKVRAGAKNSLK